MTGTERTEPQPPVNFGTLLHRIAEEAPAIDEQELVYVCVKTRGEQPVFYTVAGASLTVSQGPDRRVALVIDAGEETPFV